jgi:hypothetical protein
MYEQLYEIIIAKVALFKTPKSGVMEGLKGLLFGKR